MTANGYHGALDLGAESLDFGCDFSWTLHREYNIIVMLCKPGAEALDFVQGDAFGAAELAGRRGLKADFLAIPFGDKRGTKVHALR